VTFTRFGAVYAAEMKRLALIAAAGLALAGCGWGSTSAPRSHHPGIAIQPLVLPAPGQLHLRGSVQLLAPTRLAVGTWGSSSCPSVPDELAVQSRHAIRIHLVTGSWAHGRPVARPPANGICTADLGTTRMLVAIDPKQVDVRRPLKVSFFYRGSKKPQVWKAAPLKS
jgi:hypothetical protein